MKKKKKQQKNPINVNLVCGDLRAIRTSIAYRVQESRELAERIGVIENQIEQIIRQIRNP